MNKYMISYDLLKPGKDYSKLITELHRLGAVEILRSQWALRTSMLKAAQLRDHLRQFVDSNDRLLVTGLTGEAAWTSLLIPDDGFKKTIAA